MSGFMEHILRGTGKCEPWWGAWKNGEREDDQNAGGHRNRLGYKIKSGTLENGRRVCKTQSLIKSRSDERLFICLIFVAGEFFA